MGAQNWQVSGAGGLFGVVPSGGNSGSSVVSARDALDWKRMGMPGRVPQAEYPDGFVGNPNSRRGDRLLDKIDPLNKRQYTRGVHRGERIDPGDYSWPADWKPDRGLRYQAKGLRPPLARLGPQPRLPYDTGNMPPPTGPVGADPHVSRQVARLLPPWR